MSQQEQYARIKDLYVEVNMQNINPFLVSKGFRKDPSSRNRYIADYEDTYIIVFTRTIKKRGYVRYNDELNAIMEFEFNIYEKDKWNQDKQSARSHDVSQSIWNVSSADLSSDATRQTIVKNVMRDLEKDYDEVTHKAKLTSAVHKYKRNISQTKVPDIMTHRLTVQKTDEYDTGVIGNGPLKDLSDKLFDVEKDFLQKMSVEFDKQIKNAASPYLEPLTKAVKGYLDGIGLRVATVTPLYPSFRLGKQHSAYEYTNGIGFEITLFEYVIKITSAAYTINQAFNTKSLQAGIKGKITHKAHADIHISFGSVGTKGDGSTWDDIFKSALSAVHKNLIERTGEGLEQYAELDEIDDAALNIVLSM